MASRDGLLITATLRVRQERSKSKQETLLRGARESTQRSETRWRSAINVQFIMSSKLKCAATMTVTFCPTASSSSSRARTATLNHADRPSGIATPCLWPNTQRGILPTLTLDALLPSEKPAGVLLSLEHLSVLLSASCFFNLKISLRPERETTHAVSTNARRYTSGVLQRRPRLPRTSDMRA